jgi:uncharacterized membrane protein YbhN (UPF0104 family)
MMKKFLSRIKPYVRWMILGATLFFLVSTLKENWAEVSAIEVTRTGWGLIALSLTVTILAHLWSGQIWLLTLEEFKQPIQNRWGLQVYLKTNIAKYLPGNVWHFYGRIMSVHHAGVSIGAASLSVLLEPLLMASAALLIALVNTQQNHLALQVLSLLIVLVGVHPRILNPVIKQFRKMKLKGQDPQMIAAGGFQIDRYPVKPFLGQIGFVGLRSTGFILAVLALSPIQLQQIPVLLSSFSLAWLLGLIIPGAPGGIGIFEATALTLLDQQFSPAILLSAVAFYRLVSVLAEASGALYAIFDERFLSPSSVENPLMFEPIHTSIDTTQTSTSFREEQLAKARK